jgi:hypothetical protein
VIRGACLRCTVPIFLLTHTGPTHWNQRSTMRERHHEVECRHFWVRWMHATPRNTVGIHMASHSGAKRWWCVLRSAQLLTFRLLSFSFGTPRVSLLTGQMTRRGKAGRSSSRCSFQKTTRTNRLSSNSCPSSFTRTCTMYVLRTCWLLRA